MTAVFLFKLQENLHLQKLSIPWLHVTAQNLKTYIKWR